MAHYRYDYTNTTVSVTVIGLAVGDQIEIVVRPEPETGNMTVHDTTTVPSNIEHDRMTFYYGGLTPGTYYAINVRTVAAGEALHGAEWIGIDYFTTEPAGWVFNWTYMGYHPQMGPMTGKEKYKGLRVYVTADEWNQLLSAIYQKRGVKLSGVTVGTPISKTVLNAAANALGVTPLKRGDKYTAAFFNALKDAVNS